jgi:Fic family protein
MTEKLSLIEPMFPEVGNRRLEDLATELIAKASSLATSLRPEVRIGIADLVRSMNCYYSNLIEGHNTHPRDIERALRSDYASNATKRELQMEARAHIEVQRILDESDEVDLVSAKSLCRIHREFCSRLPEDLLWVRNPDSHKRIKIVPGRLHELHIRTNRTTTSHAAIL